MNAFESHTVPTMPADTPPGQNRAPAQDLKLARWAELLAEISALHAKLEYLNLMLRLGSTDAKPKS